MERERVSFEPNVTHQLTVEWEPEEKPGKWGTQMQYKFTGNKIAWLDIDLHDAILASLNLGEQEELRGKTIIITKRTRRNANNKQEAFWEVNAPQPAPHRHTAPPVRQGPQVTPRFVEAPPTPQPRQAQAQTQATAEMTPDATSAALCSAFDALLTLRHYSEAHGYALQFNAGDVRALAITMIIDTRQASTRKAA